MDQEFTPAVAVLVPCFNEAATIASVVRSFRSVLPAARVYVFDNDSSDDTVRLARQAGATTRIETRHGKGNVVRRMFADVEADIYLLVDGDATYDAESAPRMIGLLLDRRLDMLVARRKPVDAGAYRAGHELGNRILTSVAGKIFGDEMRDMLSGYRVFSRRFVKSFPAFSSGFQIETELTIHALGLRLPVMEVETPYFARPAKSASKLRTWRDGFAISLTIMRLFAFEKPLGFFGIAAVSFFVIASLLLVALPHGVSNPGQVSFSPSFLAGMLALVFGLLSLALGVVLRAAAMARYEARRLAYLSAKPDGHEPGHNKLQ